MSVQVYRFLGAGGVAGVVFNALVCPCCARKCVATRGQDVVQNDRVIYCQGCNPLITGEL